MTITIISSNFAEHVRNKVNDYGITKPQYGKTKEQWSKWFGKITKKQIEGFLVDGSDRMYAGELPKRWIKDDIIPDLAEAMEEYDLKEDPEKNNRDTKKTNQMLKDEIATLTERVRFLESDNVGEKRWRN